MPRTRTLGVLFAATFCVAAWAHGLSNEAVPTGPDGHVVVEAGTLRSEFHVNSVRALRDAGVVKQRYDYSCGSAALATLLSFGLNDPVDEDGLLNDLLASLTPEQLQALATNGLSLLDLQRLAQARGHRAQGFRLDQSQIVKLSRPVIVLIKPGGYEHFAVLKGLRGDRVYLADPSLGNVRMPLYRFLKMWGDASGRGVIFAVERATGDWPGHYALQLADRGDTPIEVQSANRLLDHGNPLPLIHLSR